MKFFIITGLFLTTFSPSFADDEVFEFCSSANWPPFENFNKKTNEVEGVSVDYIEKVFKKIKKTVKVVPMPWDRCLHENQNGSVNGVFSVSHKDEREKYLIYPDEPLYEVSYVIAILNNSDKPWNVSLWDNKKDINVLPKPIASPQGYSVTAALKKINAKIIDDTATSDKTNFEKLRLGRVGSIVISPEVLSLFIKESNMEGKVTVLQPAYKEPKKYYVAISKRYKGSEDKARALAGEISQALKEIKRGS
jgi:polar amino acid transport system substrate-binding protein